ncbi:hypothetical protein HMPREF0653_01448 [Prevotella disiens JCM 6334 = ATCC 29426]|uniref:Uncharacterized protein n=1 Tax=Prevotella disiens JCM 6334 = ATCC 29426 TaxID=1235811 RepID=A0ABN0NRU2_9BACT|nr:hypothetical protein HMPREF0653_01448 [Prevotella disiens JCM 6334 = ATCC 29426]
MLFYVVGLLLLKRIDEYLFYETPQFDAKIHKSIGCNKYNLYYLHIFNRNMIATDLHGVTRTTSVNIREAPMQKFYWCSIKIKVRVNIKRISKAK